MSFGESLASTACTSGLALMQPRRSTSAIASLRLGVLMGFSVGRRGRADVVQVATRKRVRLAGRLAVGVAMALRRDGAPVVCDTERSDRVAGLTPEVWVAERGVDRGAGAGHDCTTLPERQKSIRYLPGSLRPSVSWLLWRSSPAYHACGNMGTPQRGDPSRRSSQPAACRKGRGSGSYVP